MLAEALVCANVPTTDLSRVRRFYEETLGLAEARADEERGVYYQAGGGTMLNLYERPGATAEHSVATFLVESIEAVMSDLRRRGVSFEEYDKPDLKTEDGVYGDQSGFKASWFKDPDGTSSASSSCRAADVPMLSNVSGSLRDRAAGRMSRLLAKEPDRRLLERQATRHVQEHQDVVQLRTAGHRGRASRRIAAVRPETQRIQQAIHGERGRLLRRGRRHRPHLGSAARLARIDRRAEASGRGGGTREGTRRSTIRRVTPR